MNKTAIEWCDYSWNPVTGCRTGCWYCYAARMATRFKRPFTPAFHSERLGEPLRLGEPAKIFVCSAADLFGPWISQAPREEVLRVCCAAHWHTFLFLTKWPDQMMNQEFPANCWAGISLDMEGGERRACSDLAMLEQVDGHRFISFEPLLAAPPEELNLWFVEWVIIGAYTGPGAKDHAPQPAWIDTILEAAARYGLPIFMKNNLRPYWAGKLRQEWPQEMLS